MVLRRHLRRKQEALCVPRVSLANRALLHIECLLAFVGPRAQGERGRPPGGRRGNGHAKVGTRTGVRGCPRRCDAGGPCRVCADSYRDRTPPRRDLSVRVPVPVLLVPVRDTRHRRLAPAPHARDIEGRGKTGRKRVRREEFDKVVQIDVVHAFFAAKVMFDCDAKSFHKVDDRLLLDDHAGLAFLSSGFTVADPSHGL